MKKLFAGIVAAFLATAAYAQNAGTVTNHAFPIGKGPGVQGYTSLLCGSAQLAVGQAAADPICRTISGDWTLSAAGVATLATVNANVGTFGSATQAPQITLDGKGRATAATSLTVTPAVGSITGLGAGVATALGINIGSAGAPVTFNGAGGTPSSLTLTNATGLPVSTGISGLGAGCATFLGTPSSANLRGCLTDETGTGLSYFQGGDIGTPSAGVATNITALNATQLTTGAVPAARMPALTGDCTTSAGAVATTCTKINGVDLTTAFTTYVPVATCNAGTLTTSSLTGRSKTIGKTILWEAVLTITTNGTCSGSINVTIPVGTAAARYTATGIDAGLTGKAVSCDINATSTTCTLRFYDGTYPGANGAVIAVSGFYEIP